MKTGINDPGYNRKPRRISVAGIVDAGSKANSMGAGIIDPGYRKQKRPAEAGRFEIIKLS
jgi:hypothetical protein